MTASSCRVAGVTAAPAELSASSSTEARSGTSVPASQTPSQTSPSGSCARQSGCHTTGMPSTMASEPTSPGAVIGPACAAVLNGAGECTGFLAAGEWGLAETPVFLTSTMQLGRVYDAACELLMAEDPGIGSDDVIIPIVAECDDSFLNDARYMQVTS